MVPPLSYGIPRVPHYSGFRLLFSRFSYRTFTVFGLASQTCSDHATLLMSVHTPCLFPNSVWALSLSLAATQKIDYFLSLPTGTKMFQFPGFPSYAYVFSVRYCNITCSAFPHSDICGSRLICSSPQLFAACHVLLRRHVPQASSVCSL